MDRTLFAGESTPGRPFSSDVSVSSSVPVLIITELLPENSIVFLCIILDLIKKNDLCQPMRKVEFYYLYLSP